MEFVIIVVLMRSAVDVYRLRRETNSQGITIREPNKRLPLKHASNRPEKKTEGKKNKKSKMKNTQLFLMPCLMLIVSTMLMSPPGE